MRLRSRNRHTFPASGAPSAKRTIPSVASARACRRGTSGARTKLARQIEAGHVFVNGAVKSDPRMPFGGVKHSGIGRELDRYGLLEMVNIKTVEIFSAGSGAGPAKETE